MARQAHRKVIYRVMMLCRKFDEPFKVAAISGFKYTTPFRMLIKHMPGKLIFFVNSV